MKIWWCHTVVAEDSSHLRCYVLYRPTGPHGYITDCVYQNVLGNSYISTDLTTPTCERETPHKYRQRQTVGYKKAAFCNTASVWRWKEYTAKVFTSPHGVTSSKTWMFNKYIRFLYVTNNTVLHSLCTQLFINCFMEQRTKGEIFSYWQAHTMRGSSAKNPRSLRNRCISPLKTKCNLNYI